MSADTMCGVPRIPGKALAALCSVWFVAGWLAPAAVASGEPAASPFDGTPIPLTRHAPMLLQPASPGAPSLPEKPQPQPEVLAAFGLQSPQQQPPQPEPPPAAQAPQSNPPAPPKPHRFWDKQNAWLFAGVAAARALDYHSTGNMRRRGLNEGLLNNETVDNKPVFATIEAAGAITSVGLSYLFHRTNHHKLERWVSYLHIGIGTFGAVRNYCLKSAHAPTPIP